MGVCVDITVRICVWHDKGIGGGETKGADDDNEQ